MGCASSTKKKNKGTSVVTVNRSKTVQSNKQAKQGYEYNEKIPKSENEEEYQRHLAERGQQWDKYLNDKKNKYISKEGLIEMKFREMNMKKAEELMKKKDGDFVLTVIFY